MYDHSTVYQTNLSAIECAKIFNDQNWLNNLVVISIEFGMKFIAAKQNFSTTFFFKTVLLLIH